MIRRLILCDTAYIDLTEQQFKDAKTVHIIGEDGKSVKYEAKELYLERGIIMLVPIGAFKELEENDVRIKSKIDNNRDK